MNKIIIFGCGYVGESLANLIENEFQIISTHRNHKTIFNEQTSLNQEAFEEVTHILVSIPPYKDTDLVLSKHLNEIRKLKNLKWIGYLSSTGVYGDHQGNWVNEESALLADDGSNLQRIKAEKQWLKEFPESIHIFRLAGIYGPGRSPKDRIKNGTARRINKPGHYFSRIHIGDICAILTKSMKLPTPGEIFNLADDLPEEPSKVIEYYCNQLKLPYPPLEHFANLEESMLKNFYTQNKKVLNQKVKRALNIQLLHPNYMV